MADVNKPGVGSSSTAVASTGKGKWADVDIEAPSQERCDSFEVCTAKWEKIYELFGATDEKSQDRVFAAVNTYMLVNGCSPEGGYTKSIKAANGASVEAGRVVAITGRGEGAVRRFMRGRLKDSTEFLLYNRKLQTDPVIGAMAADVGLSPEQGGLLADWIYPGNPWLYGENVDICARIRQYKLPKAAANRQGGRVAHLGERKFSDAVVPAIEAPPSAVNHTTPFSGNTMF